jgi:hypothetical protein
LLNLTDTQKAIAKAAAVVAKTNQQEQKSTPSDDLPDESGVQSPNGGGGGSGNMQRSSSHESNLRNKTNESWLADAQTNTSAYNNYNNNNNNSNQLSSKNSIENMRRLSDGSELSSKCPSGQVSPNLQSPTHLYKSNLSNASFANDEKCNFSFYFVRHKQNSKEKEKALTDEMLQ